MELTAAALLFDMDGTLVDSTAVVERTWRAFADRHDLDADAVLTFAHGRRAGETVLAHAPDGSDVAAETRRIAAEELAAMEGIVALPGATELLSSIPDGRWALVTSAGLTLAERRMAAAGLAMPATVVCGDDVRAGKPDPEGYLTAARRLGVPVTETLVLEDAGTGVAAGVASGAQVLVVGDYDGAPARGLPRIADYRGVVVEPAADGRLTLRDAPPAG